MYRLLVLVPIVALACRKDNAAPPTPEPGAVVVAKPAPADDPCAKAKAEGPLAWIEDDYPAAIACAKAKHVPLVLDLWAPWCHTCLSMKATVFTDPSFKPDATKFVFASLDTDREANAAVVGKLPLSAWPTFYVINADEAVLARFVGAASVTQFHAFLDAGVKAMTNGTVGADAHLLAAERATAAKDLDTVERELGAALLDAPADWPRKSDALVSLIHVKRKRDDVAGCLQLAETKLDDTGSAASASDFLSIALDCATSDAKAEPARVAKLRERATVRLKQLLDDPKAPLSVDDRSDAMAILRGALEDLGNKPEAKAIAEKQRALLDDAAAKAPTPMAAMTYNYQRADVYAYLGRPLDIVPALEKSAADLPTEYDPRARLGRILLEGGKLDDAAKWTDEALALVYGPRKARVLALRAEIAAKQGDKATEKRLRVEVVKLWEALPPGQASPEALAAAKKALAALDEPAAGSAH
jgi:thioredoxin-like negative regulator of GroEL